VYARVSLALQVAMREWIPSLFFDEASRLEDLDLAQGMIAWRASRPAVGEHVDRLCCDILDPEMMERCFFWVERNIRPGATHPASGLFADALQPAGLLRPAQYQPDPDAVAALPAGLPK
jgi:hypothetical protein